MLVLLSSGSVFVLFFFFKQKTAYEMRISDWSSDVCSSDLLSAGSGLGPRVTAQLLRTPSISRRKSQCSRVASCFCTMKRSPLALARSPRGSAVLRSEEHTSELQSLMRISYAVFCLKKKKTNDRTNFIAYDMTSTQTVHIQPKTMLTP